MKISVGDAVYDLTKKKYDKLQITDTTVIKHPNQGGYLLQQWVRKCNDKNNNGKFQKIIRATKSFLLTASSVAGTLPLIGNTFLYIETSSGTSGSHNVFRTSERTVINQNTNMTYH